MRVFALLGVIVFVTLCFVSAQSPEQFQKTAQAAMQAELSRESTDCVNMRTTAEENNCLVQSASMAQKHFDVFYNNLLSLLGGNSEHTDQQKLREAQEQWGVYCNKSCDAIDYLYRGGSIRFSATTRCTIGLLRSRMRDLDAIYHTVLHN